MTAAPALSPGVDEPTIVLTPMRRRHLRSVLRIEQQVYPRPWSLGLYLGELNLPPASRTYVVARVGGTVVGYGGAMLTGDEGHVTTLAVDPRWQRRHIGSRLLLVVARRSIAAGVDHLTLEVRAGNRAAQELYRRFGFAPAGIRPRYYAETGEDAIVMWAHDVAEPAYEERLREIEAGLPGEAVSEGFPDA